MVRAALADGRLGDEAYGAALAVLGARGLVELVLLTGYYSALAKAMAVFGVGLPAGETPAWDDAAPMDPRGGTVTGP